MSDTTRYPIDEKTAAQIRSAFAWHPPKGDQADRYMQLRDSARCLAELICELAPPGRERSLALTNLEQTAMWANAAIARGE